MSFIFDSLRNILNSYTNDNNGETASSTTVPTQAASQGPYEGLSIDDDGDFVIVEFSTPSTTISDEKFDRKDPIQVLKLLAKTVTNAHNRTCQYSTEQIAEFQRRPQDVVKIQQYQNMGHIDLWLEAAKLLTTEVQEIIEFAKMVPGYSRLPRNDQIVLLKCSAFETAVIRASRHFDPATNSVLLDETAIPIEIFLKGNENEKKFVNMIFNVAKTLAEMKLNETQLALYSANVLLSPDRPWLKETEIVRKLNAAVLNSLRLELGETHQEANEESGTNSNALLALIPKLGELSSQHLEVLEGLLEIAPDVEFPPLHKEVFRADMHN